MKRSSPVPAKCCVFILALVLCLSPLLPGKGLAACASSEIILFMPAPEKGQITVLFSFLKETWRQQRASRLGMDFLPGRGGSFAWARLAQAPGNGCSFAALQSPSFFFLSELGNSMYREESILPASFFAAVANAIWVEESSPHHTLDDLVSEARKTLDASGGYVFLAGIGSYTDQHMATLQFNRASGVKFSYLPVVDTKTAIEAVTSKKAVACWGYALAPASMPGMRPLAVAGSRRSPVLRDAPTFQELRFDVLNTSLWGLGLPVAASEETRAELNDVIVRMLDLSDVRSGLTAAGFTLFSLSDKELPVFWEEQKRRANFLMREYPLIPRELRR